MLDILHSANENVTMNNNVPSSDKTPGFLDKFGQEDPRQQRRRAELIEDYERFKLLDEERFRNRFADKKNRSSTQLQPQDSLFGDTRVQTAPRDKFGTDIGGGNERTQVPDLEMRMDQKINDIVKKIDALQQMSESLKTTDTELQTRPPVSLQAESLLEEEQSRLYEHLLRDRLRNLQEAEDRLAAIEREYNQAKLALMGQMTWNRRPLVFDRLSYTPPRAPILYTEQQSLGTEEELIAKYSKQEQYRKELENQIKEARERRSKPDLDQLEKANTYIDRISTFQSEAGRNVHETKTDDRVNLDIRKQNILMTDEEKSGQRSHFLDTSFQSQPSEHRSDQMSGEIAKKVKYAQELREQIEEARRRKDLQKKLDAEYDRKIEEQCRKHMEQQEPQSKIDATVVGTHGNQVTSSEEDSTFARGGHGIFGNPLTDAQKTANQKYKEELAKQIEEKRIREEEKRRKQQEDEEREAARLEAEQMRLRERYEEEMQRRKQQPSEEPQKQNESELVAETTKIQYPSPEIMIPRKQRAKYDQPIAQMMQQGGDSQATEPELLISLPRKTKEISHADEKKTVDSETNKVLEQLKNLRSRVDLEKTRINEALMYHKISSDGQTKVDHGAEFDKRKPRFSRKAVHLFDTSFGTTSDALRRYENGLTSHDLANIPVENLMNQEQIAYMSALDEGLKRLNTRDILSDLELHRQRLMKPSLRRQKTDDSESTTHEIDPLMRRSMSETSLDIEKVEETNRMRLDVLANLQNTTRRITEPEELLDSFVRKHDTFSTKPP